MAEANSPAPANGPSLEDRRYRVLLQQSSIVLTVCALVVVGCYFWVDRRVAFFVHDHHVADFHIFKWLTYPPPIVQSWSPLVLALLMVRRAVGPFKRCERALLVACLSLLVANEFRVSLGDLCGRYWPETWFDNNPSLIGTGTYGFHPFHHGDDIGSFPSGHAARILGFATVWWIAVPRSRALCVIAGLPMLVSLVAMNYHFVSDVIAGATLGGIVGAYAAALARLSPDGASPATAGSTTQTE